MRRLGIIGLLYRKTSPIDIVFKEISTIAHQQSALSAFRMIIDADAELNAVIAIHMRSKCFAVANLCFKLRDLQFYVQTWRD